MWGPKTVLKPVCSDRHITFFPAVVIEKKKFDPAGSKSPCGLDVLQSILERRQCRRSYPVASIETAVVIEQDWFQRFPCQPVVVVGVIAAAQIGKWIVSLASFITFRFLVLQVLRTDSRISMVMSMTYLYVAFNEQRNKLGLATLGYLTLTLFLELPILLRV